MTIKTSIKLRNLAFLGFAASGALAIACGSDDDAAGPGAGYAGTSAGYAGKSGAGAAGQQTGDAGAANAGRAGAADGPATGGKGGATGGGAAGDEGEGEGGATGGDAGTAGEAAEGGAGGAVDIDSYAVKVTNLASDQDGVAAHTDPRLKNAWAIAINPTAQVFWLASNHGGSTPVYGADGSIKPVNPTVAPVIGIEFPRRAHRYFRRRLCAG